MNFDQAFDQLMGLEGGYSNHAADRGGQTNWGVTEAVARNFGYRGEMRALPQSVARQIYRQEYWDELKLDAIAQQAPKLAWKLFDIGVNMGTGRAAQFLQRTLNVLNRAGRDYPDLRIDGAIGPKTLDSLQCLLKLRGPDSETVIVRALNALQTVSYIELSERDPSQETFTYGWLLQRVA